MVAVSSATCVIHAAHPTRNGTRPEQARQWRYVKRRERAELSVKNEWKKLSPCGGQAARPPLRSPVRAAARLVDKVPPGDAPRRPPPSPPVGSSGAVPKWVKPGDIVRREGPFGASRPARLVRLCSHAVHLHRQLVEARLKTADRGRVGGGGGGRRRRRREEGRLRSLPRSSVQSEK